MEEEIETKKLWPSIMRDNHIVPLLVILAAMVFPIHADASKRVLLRHRHARPTFSSMARAACTSIHCKPDR